MDGVPSTPRRLRLGQDALAKDILADDPKLIVWLLDDKGSPLEEVYEADDNEDARAWIAKHGQEHREFRDNFDNDFEAEIVNLPKPPPVASGIYVSYGTGLAFCRVLNEAVDLIDNEDGIRETLELLKEEFKGVEFKFENGMFDCDAPYVDLIL